MGKRSENGFPAKRGKHGPDQDIAASWCVVGFFEIPREGPCVERSLD
jgi:hypothetical protein